MKKTLLFLLSSFLLLSGCSANNAEEVHPAEKATVKRNQQKNAAEKTEATNLETPYGVMGNSGGNILSGGIAAEYQNQIFYTDSKQLLVVSKKNVSKKTISNLNQTSKILDRTENGTIDSINVINNSIYYVKNSKIYTMNTEGKDKKELSTKDHVSWIMVYKDQVIFSTYDGEDTDLYTMGIDGKQVKKVSLGIESFFVDDNKLYWSEKVKDYDYRLYIKDLEKDREPEVIALSNIETFQVAGDAVYYLRNNDLFKMSLSEQGSDRHNLTFTRKAFKNASISIPNIHEDTVFFTEDMRLYAMDKIGRKKWPIDTPPIYGYSIAGDHLFYYGFSEGQYILNVLPNVSQVEPSNESNAEYGTDVFSEAPPELLDFYDEIADSHKFISFLDLESREETITGGTVYYPQEHIVGAAKLLIVGLSNRDRNVLNDLLADPQSEIPFDEALSQLPASDYSDFRIKVKSEDGVDITLGDDIDLTVEFKKIDGKYYFNKFIGV